MISDTTRIEQHQKLLRTSEELVDLVTTLDDCLLTDQQVSELLFVIAAKVRVVAVFLGALE